MGCADGRRSRKGWVKYFLDGEERSVCLAGESGPCNSVPTEVAPLFGPLEPTYLHQGMSDRDKACKEGQYKAGVDTTVVWSALAVLLGLTITLLERRLAL